MDIPQLISRVSAMKIYLGPFFKRKALRITGKWSSDFVDFVEFVIAVITARKVRKQYNLTVFITRSTAYNKCVANKIGFVTGKDCWPDISIENDLSLLLGAPEKFSHKNKKSSEFRTKLTRKAMKFDFSTA